ncbi:hypothetical protein AAC387_Pa01g1592 [Persea americana]
MIHLVLSRKTIVKSLFFLLQDSSLLEIRGREMGEALVSSYWCYMCSQMVNPVMETEIKCPFCESGFVEEMDSRREEESDLADRALSLWAPVLLGMLGSHQRRRRFRSEEVEEEEQGGSQLERDSEAVLQRRRRRSEAILRLFQSIHAINASESDNSEREREREPTILTNPFNQSVILQGSSDSDQAHNDNQGIFGSLGDYFFGPGLDMLLQHLVDNDPNRYGTPPAQKGAVEAMPTVKIVENLQCSICLEDFNIGSEAKEMPCKHKFHSGCILPWLELHSSCPVCRFQLPADESKDSNGSGNGREERSSEEWNGHGRRFWVPVPWPFSELFSMSGSRGGEHSSTSPASSTSASGSTQRDEN